MTGQKYLELKRLRARLLMQYYRGSLEVRLDAEEKLHQLSERYSSVHVTLTRAENMALCGLEQLMRLYTNYHESGSDMERAEIYEQIKVLTS